MADVRQGPPLPVSSLDVKANRSGGGDKQRMEGGVMAGVHRPEVGSPDHEIVGRGREALGGEQPRDEVVDLGVAGELGIQGKGHPSVNAAEVS